MTSDSLYAWIIFNVFILRMLALDLLVFHRKAHAVSLREAFSWSVVWISLPGSADGSLWALTRMGNRRESR